MMYIEASGKGGGDGGKINVGDDDGGGGDGG